MPFSSSHAPAILPDGPPLLQVVVDTEEAFDWSKPFGRDHVSVASIEAQWRSQNICERYGVKPTYVIDYPVATTPAATEILGAFLGAGSCQIGTHLHPWVSPPFEEAVLRSTSYPGNLLPTLERRKLQTLHDAIMAAFSFAPVIYKAGRYGLGVETAQTLSALGYLVDLSVVPHTSFAADGGPDFRACLDRPFWLDRFGGILEVPLTRSFVGRWSAAEAAALHASIRASRGGNLKLSALSRLGLLESVTLTPEGNDHAAHRRLLRMLLARGHKVFTLSYHSPSLAVGNTPYVRSNNDLSSFLSNIEHTLEYFFGECGGAATTPLDLREMAIHAGQATVSET